MSEYNYRCPYHRDIEDESCLECRYRKQRIECFLNVNSLDEYRKAHITQSILALVRKDAISEARHKNNQDIDNFNSRMSKFSMHFWDRNSVLRLSIYAPSNERDLEIKIIGRNWHSEAHTMYSNETIAICNDYMKFVQSIIDAKPSNCVCMCKHCNSNYMGIHKYSEYFDDYACDNCHQTAFDNAFLNEHVSGVDGYVYLLQSPTQAYKIGHTKNPESRLTTFKSKLPFEVEYIALIPSQNRTQLEKILHSKYDDKRIDGEWFELTPDDVEFIKGLKE